jgi:hypothetical protein
MEFDIERLTLLQLLYWFRILKGMAGWAPWAASNSARLLKVASPSYEQIKSACQSHVM